MRTKEGSGQVHPKHAIPYLGTCLGKGEDLENPSIVYENLSGSEMTFDYREGVVHTLGVSYVALDKPLGWSCQRWGFREIQIGGECTVLGQKVGYFSSNAASSARHRRYSACDAINNQVGRFAASCHELWALL